MSNPKREPFSWFTTRLVKQWGPRIGNSGISVYTTLTAFADKDRSCFPSYRRLLSACRMGKRKLCKALRTLAGYGLIEIEPRFVYGRSGKPGRRSNRYILVDPMPTPLREAEWNEPGCLGFNAVKEPTYVEGGGFTPEPTPGFTPEPRGGSTSEPVNYKHLTRTIRTRTTTTTPPAVAGPAGVVVVEPLDLFLKCWRAVPEFEQPTAEQDPQLRSRFALAMERPFWREHWQRALDIVMRSTYCKGENPRGWRANVFWFFNDKTVSQALAGVYNRTDGRKGKPPDSPEETKDRQLLKVFSGWEEALNRGGGDAEDYEKRWPGWLAKLADLREKYRR